MSEVWEPTSGPDRRDEAPTRGEQANVLAYLTNFRLTLEMKCEGLTAEQLARRSMPPSTMSLLGLVRHLARVEHHWHRRVLGGASDLAMLYQADAGPSAFTGAVADDAVVAEAWATWRRESAAAHAAYAGDDWDRVLADDHEVRDVVVHVLEEYARHCGHADLLREGVDGRTGV